MPLGNKVSTWEAVAFEKEASKCGGVVAGVGYIALRSSPEARSNPHRLFVNPHRESWTPSPIRLLPLLTGARPEYGLEGPLVACRGCAPLRHRAALSIGPCFEEDQRAAFSELVDG